MFISYSQEGSSYDRGLYARCFEELFDLSNLDTTSTSQYKFCVTVCELYNEQVSFCFHLLHTPFCCVSGVLPDFLLGSVIFLYSFMCFQTRDLLLEAGKNTPKLSLGSPECFVELVQEKVDNPVEFSAVLKTASQTRENDLAKNNVSHLYGLNSLPTLYCVESGFIFIILSCMICFFDSILFSI